MITVPVGLLAATLDEDKGDMLGEQVLVEGLRSGLVVTLPRCAPVSVGFKGVGAVVVRLSPEMGVAAPGMALLISPRVPCSAAAPR